MKTGRRPVAVSGESSAGWDAAAGEGRSAAAAETDSAQSDLADAGMQMAPRFYKAAAHYPQPVALQCSRLAAG